MNNFDANLYYEACMNNFDANLHYEACMNNFDAKLNCYLFREKIKDDLKVIHSLKITLAIYLLLS